MDILSQRGPEPTAPFVRAACVFLTPVLAQLPGITSALEGRLGKGERALLGGGSSDSLSLAVK